jgi:hypothetical protein
MNIHTSYKSFKDFVEKHGITETQVNDCFGENYFKTNPFYSNARCINRLSKYLNMGIYVKVVYPTNSTVKFKIIS